MECNDSKTDIWKFSNERVRNKVNGIVKGKNRFISNLNEEEKIRLAAKKGVKIFGIAVCGTKNRIPLKFHSLSEELFKKLGSKENVTEFRISRNKNVIIVTENLECAIRALNINELFGIEIETKAVEDFICSKYILRNVDVNLSVEDIFEDLWDENVACLCVTRFTKQGSKEPIPVILVSELGKCERYSMRIFLSSYRVEPFIERPSICKKCLCYGHVLANCKGNVKCAKCGGFHNIDDCDKEKPVCFRCNEEHLATSKTCDVYRNEIKVYEIAHEKAIPVKEARAVLKSPISYSNNTRVNIPSFQVSQSSTDCKRVSHVANRSEQLAEKVNEILSITAKIENVLRQLCERLDLFRIQQRRYLNELQADINRIDEVTHIRRNRCHG